MDQGPFWGKKEVPDNEAITFSIGMCQPSQAAIARSAAYVIRGSGNRRFSAANAKPVGNH
jgi:hypothetical protein